MINLISLPASNFNMPQLENCVMKNILNAFNICSTHYDLTLLFLQKCINKKYLTEKYSKYLQNCDKNTIEDINNINDTKKILTDKTKIPHNIFKLNTSFCNVLKFISNIHNLEWSARNITPKKQLGTVDELISYSLNNFTLFDDIFLLQLNSFKNNDSFYLSIRYAYQIPFAIKLANLIKKIFKQTYIVVGGDYLTQIKKNATEILKKTDFDAIVFHGDYENICNVITKKNYNDCLIKINNTITTYNQSKTSEINTTLYLPCFDDLCLEKYLSNIKIVPFYLNLGCFHSKCEFCNRYIYYEKHKLLNLNCIFKKIKDLVQSDKIQGIYFIDECVQFEILEKLSDFLINNNIKIDWIVETRFQKEFLDFNKVAKLAHSGIKEISFGMECLSNGLLKKMNKQINILQAKNILKNCYLNNIITSVTMMYNYPSETNFDLRKTLHFLKHFKYIDCFGLSEFKLARNSILSKKLNIENSSSLIIMYKTKLTLTKQNMLKKFYNNKRISNYIKKRNEVLYRTQYMYIPKNLISLNR